MTVGWRFGDTIERPDLQPHRRIAARLAAGSAAARRNDLLCLCILSALFLALVVLRYGALPMQMVDESRNALNGLGMAMNGHWLVPYYQGAPDHWNTKPPLLIWMIAGLLRLGLPSLLALRLPSMLAAAGCVGLAWWFCRFALQDRFAGLVAGLLVLASSLFVGPHVARSGDYDALLCFCTLSYVLAFWFAIEPPDYVRHRALALAATALVAAVLTKSVAGALALPGLFLAALWLGRLPLLLRDWRVWITGVAVVAVCLGYFVSRELYDPGYLHAVWMNDVGGRFEHVQELNTGGPLYYVADLARRFEPGLLLLPCAALPLLASDRRRRSAVVLCLLVAGVLFCVITASKTKLYWYAAPLVPLLSIAAAIGVSDVIAWIGRRELRVGNVPLRRAPARGAILGLVCAACLLGVWRNQVWTIQGLREPGNTQFWYGSFLNRLRREHAASEVTVVDTGLPNHGHFPDYNPMLQFYAAREASRGMPVLQEMPGRPLATGTDVASCDPVALAWLRRTYKLQIRQQNAACVFAQVSGPGNRGS